MNDDDEQTWEEALESLILKGLVEVGGITDDGEMTFQRTELGEQVFNLIMEQALGEEAFEELKRQLQEGA